MGIILASVLLGTTLGGCASDQTFGKSGYADGIGDGSITGWVCDPETGRFLADATVYTRIIDPETGDLLNSVSTTSDAEGKYVLVDLPGGTFTIYVVYGSETLTTFDVDLADGEEKVLDQASCAGVSASSVAVVTGNYDDYATALPKIGLSSVTEINGTSGDELQQFLTNAAQMASFSAIFLPGGSIEEDIFYDTDGTDISGVVPSVLANLLAYVQGGGWLFVADWSYDAVEAVWPDAVDFYGKDPTPDDAQKGEPGTVSATVEDSGLEKDLGASKAKITFDYDTWPVMESVGDGVTIYLKGNAPWRYGDETGEVNGAPLLVGFTEGEGRVLVSSFPADTNMDGDGKAVLQYVLDGL